MSRAILLILVLLAGCSRPEHVTLYCAQDREYAEELLQDFREQSQQELAIKFDTEATKSVSLYEEIIREGKRPRCSLFWNNEPLNTIRLQRQGLLEGQYHSFAARARVLIVNTRLVAEADRPKSLLEVTDAKWKGRLAMAKPQFGTTATQAACLFEALGADAAKAFYRGLKANDIQIAAGNRPAAQAVSRGEVAVALTDSDDALVEMLEGQPVAIILPDINGHRDYPRFGLLMIPNTLAMIRNGPNPKQTQQLWDYLQSPKIEARLAQGGGYQIPLNADLQEYVHPALKGYASAKKMEIDWEKAVDRYEEVQAFLRDLFAR